MENNNMKNEKKRGCIIGKIAIIILIVMIAFKGCGFLLSKIPAVPNDYTNKVNTGGEIEEKFLKMGKYDVEYFESPAMMSFKKFEIYYPKDIKSMDKLPVVVFVNGTGIVGSKYSALQKHMASWGFITIATEEEYAWNGFSAEMSVRYLEFINEYKEDEKENIFYNKIDMNRIGITGHSQGGIGVINAITNQKHSDIYKVAVILSSTETNISKALLWDSDSSLIKTNTLIIASNGDTDKKISPLDSLKMTYNNISNDVSKVLAIRKNADHGEMLYYADGYVTAWFMYYLQGDKEAAKAFMGDNPEIKKNSLYQNIEINIK